MYSIKTSKAGKASIFTFLIVFMVWANVYKLPNIPLGIGEIMMVIFFPLYFRFDIDFSLKNYERGFIIWFFYSFLVSLVLFNYWEVPLSKFFSIARVFFYWILIFFLGKNLFSFEIFKKWLVVFSIALSLFILVQSVVYFSTGIYVPGYILSAPLNDGGVYGWEMYEMSLRNAGWKGFLRPSGFLCEPAHCAEVLFLSILVVMFDENRKILKKIFLMLLFTLAVFMTKSVEGVLLFVYAWLFFVIREKKFFVFRLFLVFFLFLGVLVSLNSSFLSNDFGLFDRIANIMNGSNSIDNSSRVRLYGGFSLFFDLPFVFQLFGCGIGIFDFVVEKMGLGVESNFINSCSVILISSGWIGLLIWIFSLLYLYKKSDIMGKSLVVGFVLMLLGSGSLFHPITVWIFLLILTSIREKDVRYPGAKL